MTVHQLENAKLMHNFHSNRMPSTFDRLVTAISSVHTCQTRSSTLANTSVTQSALSMGKYQSGAKAQESGSK